MLHVQVVDFLYITSAGYYLICAEAFVLSERYRWLLSNFNALKPKEVCFAGQAFSTLVFGMKIRPHLSQAHRLLLPTALAALCFIIVMDVLRTVARGMWTDGQWWDMYSFIASFVKDLGYLSVFYFLAHRLVTRLVKLQFRLEESNRSLERTKQDLEQFLYRATHDLRAPLSSLRGLMALIRPVPAPEPHQTYLGMIDKTTLKMDQLLTELLSLISVRHKDLQPDLIDLGALLEDVRLSLEAAIYLEGVDVTLKGEQKHPFYSDAFHLRTIARNLMSNALKYQDRNKNTHLLKIGYHTTPEEAVITFTDNGIGIRTEDQERIFKMFYRATGQAQGVGLGLHLVSTSLEGVSGQIQVHSNFGKGTTFTVIIPNATMATTGGGPADAKLSPYALFTE
ncbi:Signal transduction histidine kinase [Catalinimonas alkaloidigena]|uniref:histidine kinase n=2 Tax=Catalinimonas alkaloidigena TaxID=1075417 RepID=A0A1G9HW64_9BACT|nr:Signal transduction histidine kinase [Catalinimonas alkaloidigena]